MYQRQVSFGEAIQMAFSKYCCFTGRASRSEYWWFALLMFIIGAGLNILNFATGPSLSDIMAGEEVGSFTFSDGFSGLIGLAVFLPQLGLTWRRLHDSGHSGWNYCWNFLPVIGWIVFLVYLCQPSQPEENKYGQVPNMV